MTLQIISKLYIAQRKEDPFQTNRNIALVKNAFEPAM